MNRYIKELAELALQLVADKHTKGDTDRLNTDSDHVKDLINEKFAELIVRICANVCYHHSWSAGGVDTAFGHGYKDCGDDIKQHFGIE